MDKTVTLEWLGQVNSSVEKCVVAADDNGIQVSSVIAFSSGKVSYHIRTNSQWETVYFEIDAQIGGKQMQYSLQGDGKGNWLSEDFKGCIDIDISLTPFTNSLAINRLDLKIGEQQLVNILYIDVPEQQIKKVQQSYTRLSVAEYKYENVPNDFEAVITVDESGFVVDYPNLFVKRH